MIAQAHAEAMNSTPEMTLYFSPLACSFASRAVIHDVEAKAKLVLVEHGKTEDGEDFRRIHPLGQVPALRLPDGDVITENAAVLQYLGDAFAARRLTPSDARERTRLQQWLSFIGTELHKCVFVPLLDEKAPADARAYALSKADARLGYLAGHLERNLEGNLEGEGRTSLLESGLSVADAYLCAVLNWSVATPIDLKRWPAVARYHAGLFQRPSFARALAEERQLWAERNPERARLIAERHG